VPRNEFVAMHILLTTLLGLLEQDTFCPGSPTSSGGIGKWVVISFNLTGEAHDVHTQSATRVDARTYAALGGLLTTLHVVVPVNSRTTSNLFLLVSEKGLVSGC
jgi:hypothetical protein